ncbi:MAG TPA: hypothetical protein VKE96_26110 [Vicinamibacterales bacterium]|nr:hypothetical protein [Vicinamibacterales bacterium]
MRSPAFRFTIGAAAWIAIGVAGFLLFDSEHRIKELSVSARAFDQQAREAIDAFGEARMSQQAYVAAGQGVAFWMPKVTSSSERADAALNALQSSASADRRAPIDQATQSAKEFATVERRVREYLKAGQQLMAGDVIFTEGTQRATAAMRAVETARQAESQSFDATVASIRRQEATTLGAAGSVALLVVLVLAFKQRERVKPSGKTSSSIAPTAPRLPEWKTAPVAPTLPEPTTTDTFKTVATLATDFGRIRDLDDLKRVLGRAADVMDASGVMVWMGASGGGELRPVLAHGYSADMLARIPPVPRSADNAAAKAYRAGTLQIVLARPGKSTGAVVAPILSSEGCIGALSAEIRHGAETSETTQALATMFAAHLSTVVAQTPTEPDTAEATG